MLEPGLHRFELGGSIRTDRKDPTHEARHHRIRRQLGLPGHRLPGLEPQDMVCCGPANSVPARSCAWSFAAFSTKSSCCRPRSCAPAAASSSASWPSTAGCRCCSKALNGSNGAASPARRPLHPLPVGRQDPCPSASSTDPRSAPGGANPRFRSLREPLHDIRAAIAAPDHQLSTADLPTFTSRMPNALVLGLGRSALPLADDPQPPPTGPETPSPAPEPPPHPTAPRSPAR